MNAIAKKPCKPRDIYTVVIYRITQDTVTAGLEVRDIQDVRESPIFYAQDGTPYFKILGHPFFFDEFVKV